MNYQKNILKKYWGKCKYYMSEPKFKEFKIPRKLLDRTI